MLRWVVAHLPQQIAYGVPFLALDSPANTLLLTPGSQRRDVYVVLKYTYQLSYEVGPTLSVWEGIGSPHLKDVGMQMDSNTDFLFEKGEVSQPFTVELLCPRHDALLTRSVLVAHRDTTQSDMYASQRNQQQWDQSRTMQTNDLPHR